MLKNFTAVDARLSEQLNECLGQKMHGTNVDDQEKNRINKLGARTCSNKILVSVMRKLLMGITSGAMYSWVSRDVAISLGVNSKSMHSHRREIVFHSMS